MGWKHYKTVTPPPPHPPRSPKRVPQVGRGLDRFTLFKSRYPIQQCKSLAGFQQGRELTIEIKNVLNVLTSMIKTIYTLNISLRIIINIYYIY